MLNAEMFSLKGKTALIAGASRGIGQAIGEAVARAGAHTILAARSVKSLQAIADKLNSDGCLATVLELDIASRESRTKAMEQVPEIDILINVAGINKRKNFTDYTPEEYSSIMETNLTGIFELTQAAGKKMIAQARGGKVVNIGSLTSVYGLPYVSVYGVTKAALAGLTRALAAEWGQYDIQVNCIAPGFILTDLNRDMWKPPEMSSWMLSVQPTQHMGRPEDISPLAVLLSGPGSNYITGQVIAVDGGFSTTTLWPFKPGV